MEDEAPGSYLFHGDADRMGISSGVHTSARSTCVRVRPAMLLTQRIAAQRMISLASSAGNSEVEEVKNAVKPIHLRRRGITASRMVLPAGSFPRKR